MEVKKFVFCVLFFTHAINSAEEDISDNKKISISTVKEDSLINKNNWNTKKWGSIYLLFKPNPIIFIFDILPAYTWLTLFRIFTGDILYRYLAKKGGGVMLKFGFNSSLIFIGEKTLIRLSPSLTLSFCWVYKKEGNKMVSGSFCPVGIGWGNKFNNLQEKNNGKNNEENKKKEIPEFFSKKSYFIPFLTISYLHYENGKGFFLSWGRFDMVLYMIRVESIVLNIILSLGYLELGYSLLKSKHRTKNIDL